MGMTMREGSTRGHQSHYSQTLRMGIEMLLDFCFNPCSSLSFSIAKARWGLKHLCWPLFSKRTTVSLNVPWIQQQKFYLHLLNYCTDHYTDKYIMNPWNVTQSGLEKSKQQNHPGGLNHEGELAKAFLKCTNSEQVSREKWNKFKVIPHS